MRSARRRLRRSCGTNAWTIVRQRRLASKLHGVKERGLSLARTAGAVKRDVWGTTKIYGNETAKSAAILMKAWEDGTGVDEFRIFGSLGVTA
jgi:hypothetical protein